MLTMSTALKREMARSTADLERRVEIEIGNAVYSAVTGVERIHNYPPSVASVSPRKSTLDPWSRKSELSDRTITLRADGWATHLMRRFSLAQRWVRVFLGTPNVTEAEWLPDGIYRIDTTPEITEDGQVVLSCLSINGILEEAQVTGRFVGLHPVEIMRQILQSASTTTYGRRSAVPQSAVDYWTFDYRRDVRYSHHSLSRVSRGSNDILPYNGEITEPKKARECIDDLMLLAGGTIRENSSGRFGYETFDLNAPIVRHIPSHDISRCEQLDGGIVNRYTMGFAPGKAQVAWTRDPSKTSGWLPAWVKLIEECDTVYEKDHGQSQLHHAARGEVEAIIAQREDTEWLRAYSADSSISGSNITIGAHPDHFIFDSASAAGFSGARVPPSASANWNSTQNTEDSIGPMGRRAVLMTDTGEILICDSVTFFTGLALQVGPDWYPIQTVYHIASRTGSGDAQVRVWDVTIQAARADYLLTRWAYGATALGVDLSIENADLQIGDVVSLDHPNFHRPGVIGADYRTKFEVCSVEVDDRGDEPVVRTILVWLRTDPVALQPDDRLLPTDIGTIEERGQLAPKPPKFDERLRGATVDERNVRLTIDGMEVVSVSGLTGGVEDGRVDGDAWRSPPWSRRDFAFAASSDTYLRADVASGELFAQVVSVGGNEPALPHGSARLARVTTDGSGITAILDQRRTVFSQRSLDVMDGNVPTGSMMRSRVGRVRTTDATQTTILTVPIAPDSGGVAKVWIGGKRNASADSGAYELTARFHRNGTGAVTLNGGVTDFSSEGNAAWAVDVAGDGGSNLLVRVTGVAAQTIEWTAEAKLLLADGA